MNIPEFARYASAGFKESGPWRTCNVCAKRFRGNAETVSHSRTHPIEVVQAYLADQRRDLARHEDDMAAWADYNTALALPGLPERVKKMVEKEMRDFPYDLKWEHRDDPELAPFGTERVERDIQHARAKIAEAEAWLALAAYAPQDAAVGVKGA